VDAEQFDHVAKAIGRGNSRRRVLAGLLGATLAVPLGRAAADQCKADFKPCKKPGQCCSGYCCFTNLFPDEKSVCLPCDDGNPCTTDTCNLGPGGGCRNVPIAECG
jgi:hypothetical protein